MTYAEFCRWKTASKQNRSIMTYKEFKDRVVTLLIENDQTCQLKEYKLQSSRYDRELVEEDSLCVEWSTSGMTGGNCWDDSAPRPYRSDEVPEELTSLDTILSNITPQMTFLQYKALCNKLVQLDTRSVNEYYGNYTDYMSKTIKLEELYNYLKEKNWI
jgi:hypothetical protein